MNKKKLLAIISLFFSLTAFAQVEVGGSKDGNPAPKFWIESNTYNFGNIPLGTPVTVTFKIKNTGNSPLLITNAQSTCNCTLVSYTKTPIESGESGFVSAIFDAAIMGKFDKRIFVYTNAYEGEMDLILKGEVFYEKEQ